MQFNTGNSYVTGDTVTAVKLNDQTNNATIRAEAVTDQTTAITAGTDQLLTVTSGGVIGKNTLTEVGPSIVTTLGETNINLEGSLYQGDQGYSGDMKIHQCGLDTFAYDSGTEASKTYTGTLDLPHQRLTPVEFWVAQYLNQAYHLTYRWHIMNHSAGITVMYESGGDVTGGAGQLGGAGNMNGIFGSGYSLSVGSSGAFNARKLTVTVTPGGGNDVHNIAYATLAYGPVLF